MTQMRSPFPGMDPYLERHWPDVHTALIVESRRSLNQTLPEGLVARAEERIAIDSDGEAQLQASPDIFVYSPSTGPWDKSEASEIVIEAPFKMVVSLDPVIERFVRIENKDGQLITVLEFLSPTNKRQPGMEAYQTKRAELLDGGIHVVEIDLVRAGNWEAVFLPHACADKARTLYRATVRVATATRPAYVYPIRLNEVLPQIQIPLRPKDSKVTLALQPLIETVYADGRYGRSLDYTRPLDPPLSADDQSFANLQLAAAR